MYKNTIVKIMIRLATEPITEPTITPLGMVAAVLEEASSGRRLIGLAGPKDA